jgi:hypothetical protein
MLFALFPVNLQSGFSIALIAGIGVVAAGAALLAGRAIFQWRSNRPTMDASIKEATESDPFLVGSKLERRTSARRAGNPVEVVVADATGQADLGHGWVIDRSLGGLCLVFDKQCEMGQILSVKPASAAGAIFWTQLEVRSCRNTGKTFEIGCQFLRTPMWNQLLHFG